MHHSRLIRLTQIFALAALGALTSWQLFPQQADAPLAPSEAIKGQAVKNAVLKSFDGQGNRLRLKISQVALDPAEPEQDLYLYTVLYQSPADWQWRPLCQPDAEGQTTAVSLAGRWDPTGARVSDDGITFACTNGALGKCVRWGYKPWKTEQGVSLAPFHQACTRMVRADYCGKGIGHTQNGTPIDVYDRLAIQRRTQNSGMGFEAAWGPEGAVFLHRSRFPGAIAKLQQECPEKLAQIFHPQTTAGNPPQEMSQALLFNDSFDRDSERTVAP